MIDISQQLDAQNKKVLLDLRFPLLSLNVFSVKIALILPRPIQ